MKIVYISTAIIPSRTANSIQVMKMCQAFAKNGHNIILIVPNRQMEMEPGVDDVFDFYCVDKCFNAFSPNMMSLGTLTKLSVAQVSACR